MTTSMISPESRIRPRVRIGPSRSPVGHRGADVGEPFLMRALLAGIGLAVIAAPLGCFVVWRRMAYYGETVAQAGLIGIAAGLALSLNLTASVLVVTLAVSALLVLLSRQQIVPFDSLLGLLAHAALAVGVIAASLVRGPQLDLMAFLFGDIFAITSTDLRWIYIGGAVALVALVFVWRPLLALSVHEDLAAAEGVPTDRIKLMFVLVLALVVAIAIKIVGVLLTIAFLIMPAAAARPLSETPEQMALFAAIFGALSVALGLFVSVTFDTPGGPSIVLMLALFFAAAIFPTVLRGRR
jgi:zinc transport system permease protein